MNRPLSLSLAGLTPREGVAMEPRAAIEWAAGLGYRAVQLDGAAAGVRARDLDRSGRRDLAALLRRLQLGFSGLDLWIPPAALCRCGQHRPRRGCDGAGDGTCRGLGEADWERWGGGQRLAGGKDAGGGDRGALGGCRSCRGTRRGPSMASTERGERQPRRRRDRSGGPARVGG